MTETRKPTTRQLAVLAQAIDRNEGVVFPSTATHGVLGRLQSYGWVTAGRCDTGSDENGQLWLEYPKVTDAGMIAAGRGADVAQREMTDAEAWQSLPQYKHFARAILAAKKSYHAAIDLLHEEALTEQASRESIVQPTRQTHDHVTGSSTGLCWQQVERPNGSVAPCGEPINSPVHDLAYSIELSTELRKWVASEDPRDDLVHPFE